MEVKFGRMDDLVSANGLDASKRSTQDSAVGPELEELCKAIRTDLARWRDEPAARRSPKEKAERLGMSAASEKRIAIIYTLHKDADKSIEAYRKSHEFYLAALKIEPINHWVMTQFLSIAATPVLAAAAGPGTRKRRSQRNQRRLRKRSPRKQLRRSFSSKGASSSSAFEFTGLLD
jgi:hypothetical protein